MYYIYIWIKEHKCTHIIAIIHTNSYDVFSFRKAVRKI